MEHKLWYKQPATMFEEALPLGNGSFGAMVYGGVENEKLSLNLDTLWSGIPTRYTNPDAVETFHKARKLALDGHCLEAEHLIEDKFQSMWTAFYLPLATVNFSRSVDAVAKYRRELDLTRAIACADFTDGSSVHNEVFISYPDSCLVFSEVSDSKRSYTISMESQLLSSCTVCENQIVLNGRCPVVGRRPITEKKDYPFDYSNPDGIKFTVALRVYCDGKISSTDSKLIITDATHLDIITVGTTSFIDYKTMPTKDQYSECISLLDNAQKLGIDRLKERHLEDYCALYSRNSLNLHISAPTHLPTDERLEKSDGDLGLVELLYHYGRYLTIASSRIGSQPANLQGIWNESLYAPWYSNHTLNINTEMIYWPTLPANLEECYDPLVQFIRNIADTGRHAAKNFYGARGFVAHYCSDLWAHSTPAGGRGIRGTGKYAFWNLGSAWLCQNLYALYEYTLDKKLLSDTIYPILKEAAIFYLDIMIERDGKWIIAPSTSPENLFFDQNGDPCGIAPYTTMTQAVVYDLFSYCVKSCDVLNVDKDFCALLQDRMEKMPILDIGPSGRLIEWDKEYDEVEPTHRHIAHLYALSPSDIITSESSEEILDACRKVLQTRGDEGTGWSLSWKSLFYNKLKDGDHALKLIFDQLVLAESRGIHYVGHGGTYPNMLDSCPPFVIDGNMGTAYSIIQFFLQYENEKIKLLPALPSAISDGEFFGIRTKGNVTVSIAWKDCAVTEIKLISPVSQEVAVEYNNKIVHVKLIADEEMTIVD